MVLIIRVYVHFMSIYLINYKEKLPILFVFGVHENYKTNSEMIFTIV